MQLYYKRNLIFLFILYIVQHRRHYGTIFSSTQVSGERKRAERDGDMKQELFRHIDSLNEEMSGMADWIFDHPELGLEEHGAAASLTDWLEEDGFTLERGLGGIDTAFRAVYHHGKGGPNIGLLCEYDALAGLGHACGHHMQGPSILAAASALRHSGSPQAYTVTVYGTPAEESVSGKLMLMERGYEFQELDVALMMHGSGETQTDVKSLAMTKFQVTYRGVSAHAAVKPEKGRSALDGLILAFQGVEFLREHVKNDVKIHYTVESCGGTPANIVPAAATASFYVRSYSRTYLDHVIERFRKVLLGAAMMTETEVEIVVQKSLDNKIPNLTLNEIVMENASLVQAPRIRPARQQTGSTDFGNVLHRLPGSCIRVAFVPEGTASHSQDYLDAGKSEAAHQAVIYGAKILAGTAADLIEHPERMEKMKQEFNERLAEEWNQAR